MWLTSHGQAPGVDGDVQKKRLLKVLPDKLWGDEQQESQGDGGELSASLARVRDTDTTLKAMTATR